jgi:alkyl hydroperoxide reductase subunit AhpC
MSLRLGDLAPNFSAATTDGPIDFHQWLGDSWGILLSHPADYTPVCTTELGAVARSMQEFEKRKVKVIALSVDPLESHQGWIRDINEAESVTVNFPIIADPDRKVATTYEMVDPSAEGAATVRSVFIIGPDKRVKLTLNYPDETGRSFSEILRVIDSLQLTARHRVATPADWQQGQDCIIAPMVPDTEAEALFPGGIRRLKPYLRYTPHPGRNGGPEPAQLKRRLEPKLPPHAQLIEMGTAHWTSRIVYVAAKLGLADRLAAGPKSADELAGESGTHAPSLYRLMRTLAHLGILSEEAGQRFGLTPLGEALKRKAPGSAWATILTLASDWCANGFGELLYSVQTGKSGVEKYLGMPVFDWFGKNPEMASLFSETMVGFHGAEGEAVAAAYDFSEMETIVDVGGATGHLLTTILGHAPRARGILYDLPHVVRDAPPLIESRGMTERVAIEAGSFFERVPAGGDAYLVSHVIHDWSEAQCLTILGHCRRAMNPGGRLLLIEMVLPPGNTPHPGKMLDMMMLVGPGGRERTEQEYGALLAEAGFRLTRIVPTESAVSVIEAVPVGSDFEREKLAARGGPELEPFRPGPAQPAVDPNAIPAGNGQATVTRLDPSAILQTAFGFWNSKVLLTAVELGVFSKLATRRLTRAELGAELQLHPRPVADFFDALVAMRFLEREGDGPEAKYFNTPAGALFLDENSPRYIGGLLTMLNARLFKFWNDLPEALRTGRAQNETKHGQKGPFEELYSDPARLEQFMGAMAGISRLNAETLAEKFDFSKFETLCDVGGASGLLSTEAAKRNPHLRCISFDLPVVEPIAKKHIAAMGLGDRVRTMPGDFFKDPLPKAGVITMSHILHDWNLDKKMHLIRRAYDALPPGGALVAIEALIDDARRENAQGLLMSLNMLIENGDAFDYTGADFKKWCSEAGFTRFEIIPLSRASSAAVAYK